MFNRKETVIILKKVTKPYNFMAMLLLNTKIIYRISNAVAHKIFFSEHLVHLTLFLKVNNSLFLTL